MRKIDAFAHILPRSYLDRLERQLVKTMTPSRLDYYREGVFSFDPVLSDLDARWRKIEPYGDYAPVLVLAVPLLDYFRRFHVDTALFGTDMPLGPSNAVEETISDIDAAGLSDEDRAAVYADNAARLLGL